MIKEIINKQKICIVLPTYNEAENISKLLNQIFKNIDEENKKKSSGKKLFVKVLVVDDSSPDGTKNIVKEYMKKEKRTDLFVRKNKEGLGAAYKAGMKYALKKFKPEIIFEMDADFSHDPKDIIRMVNAINRGNDFVIGSRYIKGGSTPEGWGIHRRILSYSARTITRTILKLGKIKDSSGGFRAIKKEVIEDADLDNLVGEGYGFQVSLLESAVRNGYRIKEIPIKFHKRNAGMSKMRLKDILEGWAIIFRIKMNGIKKEKYQNEVREIKKNI